MQVSPIRHKYVPPPRFRGEKRCAAAPRLFVCPTHTKSGGKKPGLQPSETGLRIVLNRSHKKKPAAPQNRRTAAGTPSANALA